MQTSVLYKDGELGGCPRSITSQRGGFVEDIRLGCIDIKFTGPRSVDLILDAEDLDRSDSVSPMYSHGAPEHCSDTD